MMRRSTILNHDLGDSLSIGDLAELTGVPPATLRTWEQRYGIPVASRPTGGHRRYGPDSVDLVREVSRHRASGLSMALAAERAKAVAERPEWSVSAGVRRRHPELRSQLLAKPALLALCRAIEDECCAQADRPLLFASFQRESFYGASEARWVELSRTAQSAIVFADFAAGTPAGSRPAKVRVPFDEPLNREWVLVCDSPDHPGCVVGWERPGSHQPATAPGASRRSGRWTPGSCATPHASAPSLLSGIGPAASNSQVSWTTARRRRPPTCAGPVACSTDARLSVRLVGRTGAPLISARLTDVVAAAYGTRSGA
jgi:DNA-binding transcriptional MerR regulator